MTPAVGTPVPTGREGTVVLLGTAEPEVVELAAALGASPLVVVPTHTDGGAGWSFGDALDAWRTGVVEGTEGVPAELASSWTAVVVAAWTPVRDDGPTVELDLDAWVDRVEAPLAVWAGALGAAAARCADGGVVVAVVERPSPLDAGGRGPESAVADGVEALVRSLARSEGGRGVRVAAVTTPLRLVPDRVVDPAPSLPSYPGTVAREVAGAVRLLLSLDAAGLTGTVLHADCGRSWR